jgi:excisionase family DNA binding protein
VNRVEAKVGIKYGSGERVAATTPRFLSVRQAAETLGIDDMTIYRAIRSNEFPAIKIRGRYLIPAKAIDDMVATALNLGTVVDVADMTPNGWSAAAVTAV